MWFLGWAGVTGVAAYLTPRAEGHGTHTQLGLPPCPSVLILDRPCPGCGLTTSFTHSVHGQIAEAFSANPLGPILYLLFTASALVGGWCYFKKIKFDTNTKGMNYVLGVVAVALIVLGGIRFATTKLNSPFFNPLYQMERSSVPEDSGSAARVPEQDTP